MKWETVIGLEVHTELSTKSKIFCGCTTEFGGAPNTHVCPVCAGMPGALPRLNYTVVEYAIRLGLALGCEITNLGKFDRKNYFYPDLPKSYQISQLYAPICRKGHVEIGDKKIAIGEIHMEEDAGKLLHDPKSGQTYMDFNRCGVPLLEIVSQPDFRCGGEVIEYLEKLREILLYLGVSDCKMQEGSLRADVNLSVRPVGGGMGVRTEMKNLNSFKAIRRAIECEAARQTEILEGGGQIVQETRRWDDESGVSFPMRSKENAQDYRYFPEPDLLPLEISGKMIENIKNNLPELAHKKRERYIKECALSEFDASVLTAHKKISDLFEQVWRLSGQPTEAARLITGEIMRLLNQTAASPEDLSVDPGKLAELIKLLCEGKINRGAYKQAVEAVYIDKVDPASYIAEKALMMISSDDAVSTVIESIISANPKAVADYRSGREKAFGFLMGQVMGGLKGRGNPELVRKNLKSFLEK